MSSYIPSFGRKEIIFASLKGRKGKGRDLPLLHRGPCCRGGGNLFFPRRGSNQKRKGPLSIEKKEEEGGRRYRKGERACCGRERKERRTISLPAERGEKVVINYCLGIHQGRRGEKRGKDNPGS